MYVCMCFWLETLLLALVSLVLVSVVLHGLADQLLLVSLVLPTIVSLMLGASNISYFSDF